MSWSRPLRGALGNVHLKLNAVRQVDRFLASLSLGTTRRDADLEDAIADKLHAMYHNCATLQHKLNQW